MTQLSSVCILLMDARCLKPIVDGIAAVPGLGEPNLPRRLCQQQRQRRRRGTTVGGRCGTY